MAPSHYLTHFYCRTLSSFWWNNCCVLIPVDHLRLHNPQHISIPKNQLIIRGNTFYLDIGTPSGHNWQDLKITLFKATHSPNTHLRMRKKQKPKNNNPQQSKPTKTRHISASEIIISPNPDALSPM